VAASERAREHSPLQRMLSPGLVSLRATLCSSSSSCCCCCCWAVLNLVLARVVVLGCGTAYMWWWIDVVTCILPILGERRERAIMCWLELGQCFRSLTMQSTWQTRVHMVHSMRVDATYSIHDAQCAVRFRINVWVSSACRSCIPNSSSAT
jgi:hypothetical protein